MHLRKKPATDEEAAEQVMRHRARVLPIAALAFLFLQVDFGKTIAQTGALDTERLVAWLVMGAVLLSGISNPGLGVWLQPRLRQFLNDELTRLHRLRALTFAFWVITLAAMGLLLLSAWWMPSAYQAIHLLVTVGVVSAVTRYAMLERRALKS